MSRSGLTLVELLVVLTILIVLTTVAFVATDQLVDQARYDTTQRTLQNISDAIVGPANQRDTDGSLLITGFVADMGRLPIAPPAPADPLSELWNQSLLASGSHNFSTTPVTIVITPTTSVTVVLPSGWRGPYLRLTAGSDGRLLDGWGNSFDAPAVGVVRSKGADNQPDPSPIPANLATYNRDLYAPDQSYITAADGSQTLAPLTAFSFTGNFTVSVKAFNTTTMVLDDPLATAAGDVVVVYLYAPVNGLVTSTPLGDDSPGGQQTTLQPPPARTGVTVPVTTTIGPRAIQAFLLDSTKTTVRSKSAISYITVIPTSSPIKTLVLQ
jgi:hypothetical protein